MNRGLLILLAIAALAAGAFLFFDDDDPHPAPSGTGNVSRGDAPPGADMRADGSSRGEAPERKRITDAVAGGSGEPPEYRAALSGIRGRLIWEGSRQPIANVEIKLIEAWLEAVVPTVEDLVGVETMRSPVAFHASTRTDEDGVFELAGVHGRSMMILAIGLKTEVAALRPVPRTPAPGELVELGDVELVERGTVTGRVVDTGGKPVAGARVRVVDLPKMAFQFGVERFEPDGMALVVQGPYRVVLQLPPWLKDYDEFLPFGDGRTDATGRFEIRGVRPGNPNLIVTKKDVLPYSRPIDVQSERVSDVGDVRIDEGEFLSGQFVDSRGEPVTGVKVTAGGQLGLVPGAFLRAPIEVDAKGRFEVAGLPRGQLYVCYQRRPKEPWEISGPHRGDEDLRFVLGAMTGGTVRIRAANPTEVAGVVFDLFVADVSAYLPGFETHVSGKGHFFRDKEDPLVWHVRELPEGIYKVIAKADGFAFGTGVLDLTKKTAAERTETIELQPAPESRFVAVDEKGRPVHAARVYWNPTPGRKLEKSRRRRLTRLPILLGKTDANGELVVDSVEAGATRFYCRHPAYALAASPEELRAGATIRFVLGRTGELAGEVAENGRRPGRAWTVLAEPTSDLRRRFAGVLTPRLATSMPDGSFSFPSIQPGAWRVRALRDFDKMRGPMDWMRMRQTRGGNAPRADVEIRAGFESFVRLETDAETPAGGGSVVGSVRVGGKPAQGAWVQTWAARQRVEVEENGTFALVGLKDGEHWLAVERPGHEGMLPNRLWEGRVSIVDGGRAVLHVDVQVGELTVEVVDSQGRAVAGLGIELLGAARKAGGHTGRARVAMTTDGSGKAHFESVPEGSYRVRSLMERNPTMTIPETPVSIFAGRPEVQRIVAGVPGVARGVVEWDENGLADDLEREYARKLRPRYLVLESEGRYTWGPVRQVNGESRFELRKAPAGTYRLTGKGALRWTSTPLVVPPGGVENATLRLRPDAARVRTAVAKLRPKPKQPGGKTDGAKK